MLISVNSAFKGMPLKGCISLSIKIIYDITSTSTERLPSYSQPAILHTPHQDT